VSEAFFFCPGLAAGGERMTLGGEEAHHAGVRRLRAGDVLTLFDGRGLTAQAVVRTLAPRGREIEVEITARAAQPPPAPAAHLCCALPKGDRLATLIDMATQLGMRSFTPLRCERSVVQPAENFATRARRIALEACKQSRRAWLPEIREPSTPLEAVRQFAGGLAGVWLAHPGGRRAHDMRADREHALALLIGPEGGFTDVEVNAALAAGAQTVELGEGILRIETAAVALLSAVRLGSAQA
jgi:16S rRNA (uracil1498-N3)-methyltransferase